MNSRKTLATFSCFIVIITTLALTTICHAQNWAQDYVDAHNAARAEVNVENIQ